MLKSKLFSLLRTLTREELAAFGRYVKRQHGETSIPFSVFSYLRKFYPEFREAKKLESAAAHRIIFEEPMEANPYNESRLWNSLSDLHLALQDFLLFQKVKARSFDRQLLWMNILKERGLEAELSRYAPRFQKELKAAPRTDLGFYLKGMEANYFFYYHIIEDKLVEDITALKDCATDLDLFYSVFRLKLACEMANRKNLLSIEYDMGVLPAVMALSGSMKSSNDPLLQLYYSVYELLTGWDDHRFLEMEALLSRHAGKITDEELYTILGYLHNYAASRLRQGNEEFWEIAHRLNKMGAEHGAFAGIAELTANRLNGIVNAACKAKDFGWALAFIQTHRHFLPVVERSNAVLLAESVVLVAKKDFHAALEKLAQVEFTDLYTSIRARASMLICHYELADSHMDIIELCLAFEAYLKRNRGPNRAAVDATLRFIYLVKMLAKGKAPRENILKEIESGKPVQFKPWLLEKAAAYTKK